MTVNASLIEKSVPYTATPDVQAVIDNLHRPEDLRFSPDGQRLAIPAFEYNRIDIFELGPAPDLTFTSCFTLEAPYLKEPHGIDWFDNTRMAIANREGFVELVAVPKQAQGQNTPISPMASITHVARWNRIKTPGSLGIERHSGNLGLWVCNNYSRRMSYHSLKDDGDIISVQDNAIRLKKKVKIPDGMAISPDNRFMAISNHGIHEVHTYALTAPGVAEHIGVLEGVSFPHGIRFAPDCKSIIVADGGMPYLSVFKTDSDWVGEHQIARRVRVVDEETFLEGHFSVREGGIKGLDIDTTRGVLATACKHQTLRFFWLDDVLGRD